MGARPVELFGRDAAEADAADLALVPQRGQLCELIVDIDKLVALGDDAGGGVEAAQVDHVEPLDPERGEVGLDLSAQLLRPLGRDEAAARVRPPRPCSPGPGRRGRAPARRG